MKRLLTATTLVLACAVAHAAPANDAAEYHAIQQVGTPFHNRHVAINAAVAAWQRGAALQPIVGQGGILLYPYGQSTPTLVCSPLRVCVLELQRGEVIRNVTSGNTVQFIAQPAYEGSGANTRPIIVIKPTQLGINTNMAITTNRRTYYVNLEARDVGMIPRAGFYYPNQLVQTWHKSAAAEIQKTAEKKARTVADLPVFSVDAMNFDYRVKGHAYFRPTQVFSVEGKTYLKMPKDVQFRQAPILLLQGKNGNTRIVNYQYIHRQWIIVDSLFQKAILVIGKGDNQVKVKIDHEGAL
jgi:type IV secretion system protein VirB9